jgi:hypothetical protein
MPFRSNTRQQLSRTPLHIGAICWILLVVPGCGRASKPAPAQAPPRPLTILISGDTAGWIVPCGCTANQSGGLLRRSTYVNDLKNKGDVVAVDAGGAPGGVSTYDRLKFEAILRGEKAMGVVAHNLGGPESALGANTIREIRPRLTVPFLSANLRDGHGELVAAPRIDVVAGGLRIAIVGVLSPCLAGKGLKADEPRDAVLKAMSVSSQPADALVVLAYLPDTELRQLAADLPEADLVVGGPTGQAMAPAKLGPTWLASATNKGKFLIRFDRAEKRSGWTGQVVEMAPEVADDPRMRLEIDRFHEELARMDLPASATGFFPRLPTGLPEGFRIAGTVSCLGCHKGDCAAWERSKHAHAGRTLLAHGDQVDPDCQRCHSNGYGLPGGFESLKRSSSQTAVGCESCHGPSSTHVVKPASRTPFTARDQCIACHDPENSPRFEYLEYWPRIVHGKALKKPAAQAELRP